MEMVLPEREVLFCGGEGFPFFRLKAIIRGLRDIAHGAVHRSTCKKEFKGASNRDSLSTLMSCP